MKIVKALVFCGLLLSAACGGESSDGSSHSSETHSGQNGSPKLPSSAPPTGTDYFLAATTRFAAEGGDSYSYDVGVAQLVPAARSPEISKTLETCWPSLDQSRLLFAPIKVTSTLRSSLPLKLVLDVSAGGSYVVRLNGKATCVSAANGQAAAIQLTSPGAPQDLFIWLPLADQISPKHPLGDPAKLAEQTINVSMSPRNSANGTSTISGPWVCDNSEIHITARAPKNQGCGTHRH